MIGLFRRALARPKGELEERDHDGSAKNDNLAKLSYLQPDGAADSRSNEIPTGPPVSPAHISRPTSPPLSARPTSAVDAWPRLRAFLALLGKSATVFGPLKMVMDEFAACIEIYEVSWPQIPRVEELYADSWLDCHSR